MAIAGSFDFQAIATAQTDKLLGGTGARGDYLSHVIFYPTTTAASGNVKDVAGTTLFTLTAGTLADLSPKYFILNGCAKGAGFTVTTVNCTALAVGSFT